MHKYSSEIRRLMLDEMSHRNASNFSTYILCTTHLQNKQFVLKFKFQRNASKFPIIGGSLAGRFYLGV